MDRIGELARFGIVGAFNAGTYLGVYAAGLAADVPYLVAATAAFLLSGSLGYWLHEHWTFKGGRPSVRAWLGWLGAQAAGIAINMGGLFLLVEAWAVRPFLAQVLLMPVPPIATYLIGRRWVFS